MKVVIVRYNAGNVASVANALARLGITAEITDDISLIQSADKVIFPGVGEAATAMTYLKERKLDLVIKNLQQPVLGLCLGMQLMCAHSEEGDTPCLGVFSVPVIRFPPTTDTTTNRPLKVPLMGWNSLSSYSGPLFDGFESTPCFYFVHSYYVPTCAESCGVAEYGVSFSAAIAAKNFFGAQFHPERSGVDGARLIQNFLDI